MLYPDPSAPDGPLAGRPYLYLRQKKDFPVARRQIRWHICPEIVRPASGRLTARVDCQPFPMEAGDLLYIPAGTLYAYEAEEAELDRLILSPAALAPPVRREVGRFPFFCIRGGSGEAAELLSGLLDELALLDHPAEPAVSRVRQALVLAAAGSGTLVEPLRGPFSARRIAHLREALEVIDERIGQPVRLPELAQAVGLSEKYFCRFFLEMTGQTPVAYINRLKAERACDLLIAEELPVSEAAARLGFHDVNYFIKLFKRFTGLTPRRFAGRYYRCASYPLEY